MFENPTVNLSALRCSCVKLAFWSSQLIFAYVHAGSSTQNAVFCKLRPSSKPTNKNQTEFGLAMQTARMKFYLTMTDTVTSQKNIHFLLNHPVFEENEGGLKLNDTRQLLF